MTIGQRIKEVRKLKEIKSQAKLAELLNTSRDRIANIESGRISIDDMFIAFFCEKLNINEHWLRTGGGDMSAEIPEDETIKQATLLLKKEDPIFQAFVDTYSKLTEENKEILIKFGLTFLESMSKKINEKE